MCVCVCMYVCVCVCVCVCIEREKKKENMLQGIQIYTPTINSGFCVEGNGWIYTYIYGLLSN